MSPCTRIDHAQSPSKRSHSPQTMYLLVLLPLLALLVILLQPLYTYYTDPYQLRRFPSAHPLAAINNLWIFTCSLSRSRHAYITAAHARHGDIVRIGPRHLSFAEPRAYKEIYGFGNGVVKDEFYSNVAGVSKWDTSFVLGRPPPEQMSVDAPCRQAEYDRLRLGRSALFPASLLLLLLKSSC